MKRKIADTCSLVSDFLPFCFGIAEEVSGSAPVIEGPNEEPLSSGESTGDQQGAMLTAEQSAETKQVASVDLAAASLQNGELSPRAKGEQGGKKKQVRRKGVLINPEEKIPATLILREAEQKDETQGARDARSGAGEEPFPAQNGGGLSPRGKGDKKKQLRRKGVLVNPEEKIPATLNLRESEQRGETQGAEKALPAHLDGFGKDQQSNEEQIRRQLAEETGRREEVQSKLSQMESAIRDRETKLEELKRKLKEAETIGSEKGAELAERAAELEPREKRLADAAASVEDRDRQLSTAAAEFEEKERRLMNQLDGKEKELREKERGFRVQVEEKEKALRADLDTKATDLRAQYDEKERSLRTQFEEKEKDLREQLEEKEGRLQQTIAELGELERRLQAANAQMGQLERDTEEEIDSKVAAAFTLIESSKAEKAMLERAVEEAESRAHAAARARERAEERAAAAEDSLVETKRELIEMRGKMAAWLERSEAQANEIRAAERTVTETLTERPRAPPKKANRRGRKGSGAERGPPKGLSLEIPDGGAVGGPMSGRRTRRPFESPLQSPRAGSVAQTPQGLRVAKSPRPGPDAQSPQVDSDAHSPRAVPDAPSSWAVANAQSPRPGLADARTPGKFSVVHAPWAEADGLRTLLSAQTPRTGLDAKSPRTQSDAKSPRTYSDAKSPRSYSDAAAAAGGPAWDPAQSPGLKNWPIQGDGVSITEGPLPKYSSQRRLSIASNGLHLFERLKSKSDLVPKPFLFVCPFCGETTNLASKSVDSGADSQPPQR